MISDTLSKKKKIFISSYRCLYTITYMNNNGNKDWNFRKIDGTQITIRPLHWLRGMYFVNYLLFFSNWSEWNGIISRNRIDKSSNTKPGQLYVTCNENSLASSTQVSNESWKITKEQEFFWPGVIKGCFVQGYFVHTPHIIVLYTPALS